MTAGGVFAEAMRAFVREGLHGARVCLPARVETYDAATHSVNARPLVGDWRIVDGEEVVGPLPVISRVPVQCLRWGGYTIRCPLAAGDRVLLVFADRELERWLAGDGAPVDPGRRRQHDLNDAVAIPGISPWSAPPPGVADGDLVLGREDGAGAIRIHADGSISVGASGATLAPIAREGDSVVIDSQDFLTWVQAIAGAAGPRAPIPFTGQITGRITSGSARVEVE